MEIEILHAQHGDKRRKIDTSSEKGRQEVAILLNKLMKMGTAILLERGKKTFYVKRYDPKRDLLTVSVERRGESRQVTAKGKKSRAVAVPRAAGGTR
jgi:hypothetical protein